MVKQICNQRTASRLAILLIAVVAERLCSQAAGFLMPAPIKKGVGMSVHDDGDDERVETYLELGLKKLKKAIEDWDPTPKPLETNHQMKPGVVRSVKDRPNVSHVPTLKQSVEAVKLSTGQKILRSIGAWIVLLIGIKILNALWPVPSANLGNGNTLAHNLVATILAIVVLAYILTLWFSGKKRVK